jgi:outer membrane protein OmpA-like peptidoglycan-associated protein
LRQPAASGAAAAAARGPGPAAAAPTPAAGPPGARRCPARHKGEIEFDTAQATIKNNPASMGVLNAALGILKATPQITKIRIEGHTDSDGNAADNQKLSEARAAAVVKWLVDNGVAPGRFVTAGCAARDPLFPNDTPEHKARNRRTEFDLEELAGKRPDGYTLACAPNPSRH